MKKKSDTIIVLGVGPTPIGNPERVYAPGLRLFAFSKYIHQAEFRTIMGEACFEGGDSVSRSSEEIEPGWERRRLPLDPLSASGIIDQWIREVNPVALVSTTDVMNRAISLLETNIARWMDFNGHPMAERQELGFVHNSDEGLIDQWLYIIPSLLTGDRFSTCSTPQKFALIGELGAVGRLNRYNSGHDLVTVMKPGAVLHEPQPEKTRVFRGEGVPSDAFGLLWNGGFNTWVDEKTLYEGVCLAMKESEKIHFIVTGGEIKKHNEITFERFRKRVMEGSFKSRFHFFGWVPLKRLSNFYIEADAAINIDRFTYEAILGFRNRIFSWMNFNLPIITTPLSENTKELVSQKLAVGFSPGQARELADGILYIMKNPDFAREMARNARKYLLEEYDYAKILQPLLDWLAKPRNAPDRAEKNCVHVEFQKNIRIAVPDNSLSCFQALLADKKAAMRDHERKINILNNELEGIRSGRAYKWLKRLNRIFGKD